MKPCDEHQQQHVRKHNQHKWATTMSGAKDNENIVIGVIKRELEPETK